MAENIIVSRHPAAIAFIRAERPELADAPVLASATVADVAGRHVYGNVPLGLAVHADGVTTVEFAGPPPRGAEYGIAEMRAAGAHLATYTVVPGRIPWAKFREAAQAAISGEINGSGLYVYDLVEAAAERGIAAAVHPDRDE